MAGYSSAPLEKKLGIKEGFKIKLVNEPEYYWKLFSNLSIHLYHLNKGNSDFDFVHLFVTTSKELIKNLPSLRKQINHLGIMAKKNFKNTN